MKKLKDKYQMTARNKRWLKAVSSHPCIVTGSTQTQIHHVEGRTAEFNGVHIGHIYILPLNFCLHDVNSNHAENVTFFRKVFERTYGNQELLFLKLSHSIAPDYKKYGLESKADLPTFEEIESILRFRNDHIFN